MEIFISYAHEDRSLVEFIVELLKDVHVVWHDPKLSIGQEWQKEIEHQIAASHCFLFVLSPRSMQSEYCRQELAFALELQKPIAPVMIEEMGIPEQFSRFQVIQIMDDFPPESESVAKLLNGLTKIERKILIPPSQGDRTKPPLRISELYFATTNQRKKIRYEQILNTRLQAAAIELDDIQHCDAGEVAIKKVKLAFEKLRMPVFVDQSALAIRAWGGLPGGLSNTFIVPLGLSNLCRMLQPFADKHAEAISVIAFTDGQLVRTFVGRLVGEIASEPRGIVSEDSWKAVFIPSGFSKTLSEMSDEEVLSISNRRQAMIEFKDFLQSYYDIRS